MFSFHNHKIVETGKVYGLKSVSFDLLSGHSCPMADRCHSQVDIVDGKRKINDMGEYRCYATKAEMQYPAVYNLRKSNMEKTLLPNFVEMITGGLEYFQIKLCRIHSAGDFYSWEYFQKWYEIAKINPHIIFFGYSKQATFIQWLMENQSDNLKINYSMGGKLDKYAIEHQLPATYVMTKENEDELKFIPLACIPHSPTYTNDFEYIMKMETFKIALH